MGCLHEHPRARPDKLRQAEATETLRDTVGAIKCRIATQKTRQVPLRDVATYIDLATHFYPTKTPQRLTHPTHRALLWADIFVAGAGSRICTA